MEIHKQSSSVKKTIQSSDALNLELPKIIDKFIAEYDFCDGEKYWKSKYQEY